jgi:hypothetical protein
MVVQAPSKEIRIYSHSGLFYWWPVWVFGFLFALWTWVEGNRLAIVPNDSVIVNEGNDSRKIVIEGNWDYMTRVSRPATDKEAQEYLALAKHHEDKDKTLRRFGPHVSSKPWMGPIFLMILCLVIIITNVPLRGLWSLVVTISLVMIALIISLFGWWDDIFSKLFDLHVFINMAGYLFIASVVFTGWAIATFIFDKRSYIIFTPGQIKVCEQLGGREKVYDTTGMTIEKHRDDWFRHIFLGFGSGDLSVRTAGADRHEIIMPNVALVGFKIGPIEQLLRERQMSGKTPTTTL